MVFATANVVFKVNYNSRKCYAVITFGPWLKYTETDLSACWWYSEWNAFIHLSELAAFVWCTVSNDWIWLSKLGFCNYQCLSLKSLLILLLVLKVFLIRSHNIFRSFAWPSTVSISCPILRSSPDYIVHILFYFSNLSTAFNPVIIPVFWEASASGLYFIQYDRRHKEQNGV